MADHTGPSKPNGSTTNGGGSHGGDAGWQEGLRAPGVTPEQFTELFARAVRESLAGAIAEVVSPLHLLVTVEDGTRMTVYLENAWRDFTVDPEMGESIVERLLRAMPARASEPGLEGVVPLVKDERFIREAGRMVAVKAEPLAADLWVVYAQDSPDRFQFLPADFEVDLEELRQRALENLRALLPPVEMHGGGPVFMLTAGGNFEASLLLLDALWDELAGHVEGEPVVAVPSRDVLILTGSASPEGIAQARELVARVTATGSHLVSATLLVRRAGAWMEFVERVN